MKATLLLLTAAAGLSISSCAVSQEELLGNIEKASSIAKELAPLIITNQK